MTQAEALASDPDDDLRAVMDDLRRVSAASKSEARYDRGCNDGSSLVATSRDGSEVAIEVVAPVQAE